LNIFTKIQSVMPELYLGLIKLQLIEYFNMSCLSAIILSNTRMLLNYLYLISWGLEVDDLKNIKKCKNNIKL